jgi:unsaturated rhamnogalacturonyl hydrolase
MMLATIARAADMLTDYRWKMWFWGDGIGLEGLLDATDLTGNQKYLGYVHGLFKGWISRIEYRSKFDHTAAGVALVRCHQRTGDPALLEAARDFADYLQTFRRSKNGCPIHYDDAHLELPPELPVDHPQYSERAEQRRKSMATENAGACVFVDSVHFQGPFLASLYAVTKEERYLEQCLQTIVPQIQLLWDPAHQLFHHFWIEAIEQRNGILWGRGNGWGLLGLVETLQHIPPHRAEFIQLKDLLNQQVKRLAELQDKSGDWYTVLDRPDSYLESSVAAFIIAGFTLAVSRGWIDKSYLAVAEKAWRAMWRHVRESGLVDGVSFETFPSRRAEHYCNMPRGGVVPWGQGPFLVACSRFLQLRPTRRAQVIVNPNAVKIMGTGLGTPAATLG